MFQGQSLRVTALEPVGIFELCFDRAEDAINRFDERTVAELRQATRLLDATAELRGVLVTSAKDRRGPRAFAPAEIVDRMMLPMIVEAAHALEEGVVGTAADLDTALLLGLGFPAYAGGPLQHADWLGLEEVVLRCDRLRALGPAYDPTPRMRAMAARGARYHGRIGH